jgi:transposase-like protein
MDFPVGDLMDEQACYDFLVNVFQPDGICCPNGCGTDRLGIHKRDRAPILVYRCKSCRRVFTAFTGTVLANVRRSTTDMVLIIRGITQGVSTAQLARELQCDPDRLLDLRHKIQAHVAAKLDRAPLQDEVTETDEMFQNAGEKGILTQTWPTRQDVEPTNDAGTETTIMTARRL